MKLSIKNVLLIAMFVSCSIGMFLLGQFTSQHDTTVTQVHQTVNAPSGLVSAGTASPPTAKLMEFIQKYYAASRRFSTHLSTDKPLYRPSETVRIRGVLLGATSYGVLKDPVYRVNVQIKGPKGDIVTSLRGQISDSTLSANWVVPVGTPGGAYKIRVTYDEDGFAPAERSFKVREFRNPSLRLQLEFERDGYGPSDQVVATVSCTRADGGVPVGAKARWTARNDGKVIASGSDASIQADGTTTITFKLPSEITVSDGSLNVIIADGGNRETVSKTLPLLLETFDISVFPEGGDLVAGLPSRLYVEGVNTAGNPADFEATIVKVDASDNVQVVATVKTGHEGRGVTTTFTPVAGMRYQLRVTAPATAKQVVEVPQPKPHGVVVGVLPKVGGVFKRNQPITVTVASSKSGDYRVVLFRREQQVASSSVHFQAGFTAGSQPTSVTLSPLASAAADGVLRVTVYDMSNDLPVAERLVFRQPAALNVEVFADKSTYRPGDTVNLRVRSSMPGGQALQSILGITVTDDSVMQKVERRLQAPRLPAMAFLEHEVKSVADPHTYLGDIFPADLPRDSAEISDTSSPLPSAECFGKAAPAVALDLLLGTQGWRRFVYETPSRFVGSDGADKDDADTYEQLFVVHKGPEVQLLHARPMMAGGMPEMARARGAPMPMMFGGAKAMNAGAPAAEAMPDMAMAGGAPPQADGGMVQAFAAVEMEEQVDDDAAEDEAGAMGAPGAADHAAMPMPPVRDHPAGWVGGDAGMPPPDLDMVEPPRAPPMRAKKRGPDRMKHRVVRPSRMYAHQARANRKPNQRTDFTDTVFWAASQLTNMEQGETTVTFQLADSITSLRIEVDAVSKVGSMIGSATASIQVQEPFFTRLAMPTELTDGDKVSLAVTTVVSHLAHGASGTTSADITLQPSAQGPLSFGKFSQGMTFSQTQHSSRSYLDAVADLSKATQSSGAGGAEGDAEVISSSSASREVQAVDVYLVSTASLQENGQQVTYHDSVSRSTRVMPRGFPMQQHSGGMVAATSGHSASYEFQLPAEYEAGSLQLQVAAYPSPVASLTEALEALIRQPCGCFEQTASTTYPLTMAAQYFKSHAGVDPSLIRRSREMLEAGYKRLLSFESEGGGFEWFGGSPGHEALTAYGVLQFVDMAKVMSVDSEMLARTKAWLLDRRDGEGGFARNERALDSFGRAPAHVTNAYIVWALTETEMREQVREEVEAMAKRAFDEDNAGDAYLIGLAAASLYNMGDAKRGKELADKLVRLQVKSGAVEGSKTSITCSGGDSLTVEGTSITILAWMNDYESYGAHVRQAVQYLTSRCKRGAFGSTQATVLALKAIIAYDVQTASPPSHGEVTMIVNGEEAGSVSFTKDSKGALNFDTAAAVALLKAGNSNKIELSMTAADTSFSMPYSVTVDYSTETPPSAQDSPLQLTTRLADSVLVSGGTTELQVSLRNKKSEALPMVVAIVGIPGGLELRDDKLDELVSANEIAFYEINGRSLVLYWRGMAPDQALDLSIDVQAAVAGEFTGDASRAYPYYHDEAKVWVEGVAVRVQPATE